MAQRQQNRTQNTTKSHSFFSHIAKCFNGHWFGLCGPSKRTWRQRMSWRRYRKAMDGDELGRAPGKVIGNRWNLIFLCIDLFTIAWVNIYLVSRWCSVYIISFVFFSGLFFFVSFRFDSVLELLLIYNLYELWEISLVIFHYFFRWDYISHLFHIDF